METETRQCQNCKQDFIIDQEDFNFYEKMQVPHRLFAQNVGRRDDLFFVMNGNFLK